MNIFVMSDKQGSGKTFISAGLAATMQSLGYSVGYFKPIQTGAEIRAGFPSSRDITFVRKIDPYVVTAASYVFKTDALPLTAAEKEGFDIKPEVILKDYLKLKNQSDVVISEACGGILTPVSADIKLTELIKVMNSSLLIVSEPQPQSLDKILLTVAYAKLNDIDVRGVILNKCVKTSDPDTRKMPSLIEEYSGIPVIGMVKKVDKITPSGLIDMILHSSDVESIFGIRIPKLD